MLFVSKFPQLTVTVGNRIWRFRNGELDVKNPDDVALLESHPGLGTAFVKSEVRGEAAQEYEVTKAAAALIAAAGVRVEDVAAALGVEAGGRITATAVKGWLAERSE